MFSSDDSGLPDNAGDTGDASIGSDTGSVAAPVPAVDLLGEDVDITPARPRVREGDVLVPTSPAS